MVIARQRVVMGDQDDGPLGVGREIGNAAAALLVLTAARPPRRRCGWPTPAGGRLPHKRGGDVRLTEYQASKSFRQQGGTASDEMKRLK